MDAITVEKPHAAMQQARGTMRHDANRFSEIDRLAGSPAPGRTQAVISPPPREFLIQGLTRDGKRVEWEWNEEQGRQGLRRAVDFHAKHDGAHGGHPDAGRIAPRNRTRR